MVVGSVVDRSMRSVPGAARAWVPPHRTWSLTTTWARRRPFVDLRAARPHTSTTNAVEACV